MKAGRHAHYELPALSLGISAVRHSKFIHERNKNLIDLLVLVAAVKRLPFGVSERSCNDSIALAKQCVREICPRLDLCCQPHSLIQDSIEFYFVHFRTFRFFFSRFFRSASSMSAAGPSLNRRDRKSTRLN